MDSKRAVLTSDASRPQQRPHLARAVFLDRDGTLVHPRSYPRRPQELRLYAGIGAELRTLQQAGFLLIVVTNQSGIARGLLSEADLERMHAHLIRRLRQQAVRLDAIYHCPHHPEGTLSELSVVCECRKPAPGLVLRAAVDLDLALERSWLVGDSMTDIEAGRGGGCRTILVDLGTEPLPQPPTRAPDFAARNTRHALGIISAVEQLGPPVDLCYQPPRWRPRKATFDGATRNAGR